MSIGFSTTVSSLSVDMDVNYALTKEETDAGFVLACQSHPMTDRVVLDFDVK